MLRQLQIAAIVIVIVHAFAKLVDVGEGFFCADVDIALPLFFALEECQICDCDSVANVVVIAVFIVVVFIAAIIVVVVVE